MAHQTLHADETDTVEFHEVFSVVEMGLQEFDTYEEAVGEAALELGEGARFQVEKTIVVETIVRADQPSTIDNPPPAPPPAAAPIPVAVPPVVAPPAAPVEEQPTEPVQAPLVPPADDSTGEVADSPGGDSAVSGGDAGSTPVSDPAASPVVEAPDAWQDDPAHNTEPGPIDTSNAIFTPTPATPATPSSDTPATPTTSTEPVPDTEL